MSRPKPVVIIEHTNTKTYRTEQILKADAVYAVYYNGEPINIRTINAVLGTPLKYKKVSHSAPGHAISLAKKLNKRFGTTAFKVYRLVAGEEHGENWV